MDSAMLIIKSLLRKAFCMDGVGVPISILFRYEGGFLMSQVLAVKPVRSRRVVVTWFGNCSYRELKVTYEVRKMVCPLCGHDLEDGDYSGRFVFCKNKNLPFYVRD